MSHNCINRILRSYCSCVIGCTAGEVSTRLSKSIWRMQGCNTLVGLMGEDGRVRIFFAKCRPITATILTLHPDEILLCTRTPKNYILVRFPEQKICWEFSFMSNVENPRPVGDTMPEMIVKIIGSKYVRYPANKSEACPVRNKDVENNGSEIRKILGGIYDVESFRQSLLRMDRSSCGLLLVSEFQTVCESHGASVPLLLLTSLLKDNAFIDRGKIRWKNIVDLLYGPENENNPSEQEETEKEDICFIRTQEDRTTQPDLRDISETSESSYSASKKSNSRWDAQPVTEPALHLFERRSSEDREDWIDRFNKLETVLQLCQIKDTGLVETERAKEVIHKFNLIYNLTLSPEKITEALEKFSSGDGVILRSALLLLKEL